MTHGVPSAARVSRDRSPWSFSKPILASDSRGLRWPALVGRDGPCGPRAGQAGQLAHASVSTARPAASVPAPGGTRNERVERPVRRIRPSAHDGGRHPRRGRRFRQLPRRPVAGCRAARRHASELRALHRGPDARSAASWICSMRSRNSPRRSGTISILLVSDERIARGRELLTQYAPTFAAVERAYGVDRYIIAAIWGVESNYGTLRRRPPGAALDRDLACVGRRRDYFREEFLSALEILQRGDIAPGPPGRLVGRRVRPDAVHADHVQALRGRLRRRRPARRHRLGSRHDRVDRQQSETGRLGQRPDLGLRSRVAAEFQLSAGRPLRSR